MCAVNAYEIFYPSRTNNGSSGDGIPFPFESSTDALESLAHNINNNNNNNHHHYHKSLSVCSIPNGNCLH